MKRNPLTLIRPAANSAAAIMRGAVRLVTGGDEQPRGAAPRELVVATSSDRPTIVDAARRQLARR